MIDIGPTTGRLTAPRAIRCADLVSANVTNQHTHQTFGNAGWSYNEGSFWGQFSFNLTFDDLGMTFKCIDISEEIVKKFPRPLSGLSHQ